MFIFFDIGVCTLRALRILHQQKIILNVLNLSRILISLDGKQIKFFTLKNCAKVHINDDDDNNLVEVSGIQLPPECMLPTSGLMQVQNILKSVTSILELFYQKTMATNTALDGNNTSTSSLPSTATSISISTFNYCDKIIIKIQNVLKTIDETGTDVAHRSFCSLKKKMKQMHHTLSAFLNTKVSAKTNKKKKKKKRQNIKKKEREGKGKDELMCEMWKASILFKGEVAREGAAVVQKKKVKKKSRKSKLF